MRKVFPDRAHRDALGKKCSFSGIGVNKPRKVIKGTMTTPDADSTAEALANSDGTVGSSLAVPPARPHQPPISTKGKNHNIQVSPAVLDAARKDGEELLRDLRTSLCGLRQA